jgi:two-component system LytT family sensor kinase
MRNKGLTLLAHAAGWILFLSLPVLFITGQREGKDFLAVMKAPPTLLFVLVYTVIFYLHTYVLLPYLYASRKYIWYTLMVVVLLAIVFWVKPFDKMVSYVSRDSQLPIAPPNEGEFFNGAPPPRFDDYGPPPPPRQGRDPQAREGRPVIDQVSVFLFIMIMALSLAIYVRQRLRYTEQRALKAEADKANAELSFLKAQINPHFLFNTLNNIYSLAVTKNEHTAESIMKLSNIMRYVTDDISEDYVELDSELECIRDYIDLQKLRLNASTKVEVEISGDTLNKKIAPLILMTFVENVFKYGVSNHAPSEIVIRIAVEQDAIRFYSRNNLFRTVRKERTGIGIANTRQRLEYLYPGKHNLVISERDDCFFVQLDLVV